MNFPFFIAKRYLFHSRRKNLVNIISYISLFGIAIATAALIIVLSVFNGFEKEILDRYNSFDPHIKISYSEGKTFDYSHANDILSQIDGIEIFSNVLEEDIFFRYNKNTDFARIKGVDENYLQLNKFNELLIHPDDSLTKMGNYFDEEIPMTSPNGIDSIYPCNVGYSLAGNNAISIYEDQFSYFLNTVLPKRNSDFIRSEKDFIRTSFYPSGFFAVHPDYDSEYIICSFGALQKMLNLGKDTASSIEIMIDNPDKIINMQNTLKKELGGKYIVKTRMELGQHELLNKIINSEKLASFIILTFILIIASFNIVSSLSMIIIDKKKDIKILSSLGSSNKQIQNVFFTTGFLGVIIGSLLGVFLGILISLLQENFHFLTIGENSILEYYPIQLNYLDIMLIEITVLAIGFIATYYPSRGLINKLIKLS